MDTDHHSRSDEFSNSADYGLFIEEPFNMKNVGEFFKNILKYYLLWNILKTTNRRRTKTMLKIIAAKSHNKESNSASLHGCF